MSFRSFVHNPDTKPKKITLRTRKPERRLSTRTHEFVWRLWVMNQQPTVWTSLLTMNAMLVEMLACWRVRAACCDVASCDNRLTIKASLSSAVSSQQSAVSSQPTLDSELRMIIRKFCILVSR